MGLWQNHRGQQQEAKRPTSDQGRDEFHKGG
jgi:hypothetical protein